MLRSVWPRINASLCCSAFELWLPGARLNGIGRQSVSPVRKVLVACHTLLRDCITHQAADSTVLLSPRPPPLPLLSFRLESMSMGVNRLTLCLSLCSTWFCLAEAMQGLLPTPIFAGLRAAQVDLGIKPTSAPRQHEIWKRLSGDPAICGWIEGDSENTVSCNSGYTCAATSTYIGCCSTGAAGCKDLYTTCYDRLGPSCDARCKLNNAALACDGQAPFCATYQYAEGRRGYGCAAVTGYNKTVLTTTNPGILPFGESASTSATGSGSDTQQATVTAAVLPASSSEADMTLISGGAIAGAVAGSVLALAAIVGIFLFFRRRHRFKKEQQRLAATSMPERSSSQYMYAQYAKPPPSTLSPPTSPPMHSRHPSDQNYGFQSSPPLSDNDRPWSPETVTNEVAELSVGDETTNIHNR
ncbi:hypothetical protein XANCAGTX0491_009898 [Xanthoria calcicola]